MLKKNPHQSGELIRGGDNPIIAKPSENSNIPISVIKKLEDEIQGVDFGGVSLVIAIRDSHRTYRIEKTVSIITGV